jgi:hypothetical protein
MYTNDDVQAVLQNSDRLNEMAAEIKKVLAILAGLLKTIPLAEGLGSEIGICVVNTTRYFMKTSRYIHPTSGPGADIYLYEHRVGEKQKPINGSIPLEAIEPIHERLGSIMESIAESEPKIVPAIELLRTAGRRKT